MPTLASLEKRVAALERSTPVTHGEFNVYKENVVMVIFLLARLSGRGYRQQGMRILPPDWKDRAEMHEAVWDRAHEIGAHQWDIFYRSTHKPLSPEYAKQVNDNLLNLSFRESKPLSHYEAEYNAYPHVTEEELAWCPREAFWEWFDQEYPEEPRNEF